MIRLKLQIERKKDGWEDMLGAREETMKERYMEIYKRKRESLRDVGIRVKRKKVTVLEGS